MQKRKIFKIIFSIIILLLLVPYYFLEDKSNLLKIYFIDVGQGDGILIKTPNDKTIIIDGGPFDNFSSQISSKLPYRKRNIDLIIITHAHQDHYLGLINVIKNYKVDNIMYSGYNANFLDYNYLMNLIKQKNINLITAKYGQNIDFDENIKLKTLYPISQNKEIKDINNTSVAIMLSYKNFDAIFTGDMTCEGEVEVVKNKINIESEILKIGHHGSRGSSCDDFLQRTKAKTGIIQVGIDNSFNHPHKELLDRLKKYNIEILRTDQLGDILITSDGNQYYKNIR